MKTKSDSWKSLKTVKEWLAAGHFETGAFVHGAEKETEKAIAIKAEKLNRAGNLYEAFAWFPKSQLKPVENDHYVNDPDKILWLVPHWLFKAKEKEGFVF